MRTENLTRLVGQVALQSMNQCRELRDQAAQGLELSNLSTLEAMYGQVVQLAEADDLSPAVLDKICEQLLNNNKVFGMLVARNNELVEAALQAERDKKLKKARKERARKKSEVEEVTTRPEQKEASDEATN